MNAGMEELGNASTFAPSARRGSERSQQQCTRILDAAQHCFIKSGFHAAGMASSAVMTP